MDASDSVVVLTDHPWPDDAIERKIIEQAGHRLLTMGGAPQSELEVDAYIARAQPDAIMTCWAPVSASAIASVEKLSVVARLGVGLDNIAVEEASRRGVWVTNVPDYCVEEVSDHALAMILTHTRGILRFDAEVRGGQWRPATARLKRLGAMTIGIIGYGRIGRRTAEKLAPFGCRVLVSKHRSKVIEDGLVVQVPLDQLLATSDVVVLHAPLTTHTRHLIDSTALATMRPDALLVNVSRGGLIDTTALVDALGNGLIGGAALDVLESEPDVPPELAAHPQVTVTPHVAFSSDQSLVTLRRQAAEEVVRVLSGGTPERSCNRPSRAETPVPREGAP